MGTMADTTQTHLPTIVYVEDNTGDAVLLEEALRERRHATQLLVIDRGDQALHYFQVKESARDLPPPHCILLDAHLPIITGAELLRFLRGSPVYNATPVYLFANSHEYQSVLEDIVVSPESFIAKATSWKEFLELADLLMRSASANQDQTPASPTDVGPEAPATGVLRLAVDSQGRPRVCE